ncbi:hypothetical protein GLOIN_2v1761173 [Rhizophagus irregularis DAOM 181602=DAOM 197198]|uniref:Uncharacterized protein n=1 Tax=Rhizophagus irregularis (strain DAOM 181602 / DAOM 197198 / MUCL 43194) TaxID=747089 RepID=A0A2P4QZR5_RHIID|nr:hypothetical protein GLOIN_2v1761173 [Rhizophagus irregularis DAOM 181602=DAOM 197198]POG83156.1 hypothetical protein GLOIN_2v1761173 [Rhizophagus irregularis DAOM 181602=DAOM 197198]|eukprot:XP_025190022.1 hypothetical protein GLOIN_2v1761173 [Rhizophagus irregularis DAOM 181602=DAOM 197198]
MYPLQDNNGNSDHESNFTEFINETTATTITHAESINCGNPSCYCNRSDISVQPTFNDFSNNNFNISPNNKYHQQSMSSPRQFHSQYIDQNPPQTNVFPSLNSPGIVINSPQTYVIIMPVPVANPDIRQQDTCSNYSITDSQFRQ